MISEINRKLTPEEISEFQGIVKRVKNIDLTFEEAENQASRMVKLAYLVLQNSPLENNQQKRQNTGRIEL